MALTTGLRRAPGLCLWSWGASVQPLRVTMPWKQRQNCSQEPGTTQLAPTASFLSPWEGLAGGWGTAGPRQPVRVLLFPEGLVPRDNRPNTASRAQATHTAPWPLPDGFEGDPNSPLICTQWRGWGQLAGVAAAPLCTEHRLNPPNPVNIASMDE